MSGPNECTTPLGRIIIHSTDPAKPGVVRPAVKDVPAAADAVVTSPSW
jgi:hypothetical protein